MLFDPTNWILVITIFLWCIAFIDSISEKKFPSQCVDEYRVQFRGTSYCKIHHRLEKYRKRELAMKKRSEEENTSTTKSVESYKIYYHPKTSTTKKSYTSTKGSTKPYSSTKAYKSNSNYYSPAMQNRRMEAYDEGYNAVYDDEDYDEYRYQ